MSKYKMIEGLGLNTILLATGFHGEIDYVRADKLEALLGNGAKVYGTEIGVGPFYKAKAEWNTYSGLLINYKPIPKPVEKVSKKELVEKLIKIAGHESGLEDLHKLIKRIEEAGIE